MSTAPGVPGRLGSGLRQTMGPPFLQLHCRALGGAGGVFLRSPVSACDFLSISRIRACFIYLLIGSALLLPQRHSNVLSFLTQIECLVLFLQRTAESRRLCLHRATGDMCPHGLCHWGVHIPGAGPPRFIGNPQTKRMRGASRALCCVSPSPALRQAHFADAKSLLHEMTLLWTCPPSGALLVSGLTGPKNKLGRVPVFWGSHLPSECF